LANYICRTCAVQYTESTEPPASCKICDDERQWIPRGGQKWTTLDQLRERGQHFDIRQVAANLWGFTITPGFGIGQRPLIVQTSRGNLLWDCVGYIDDELVARISNLGGLQAIAVSHPHFYGAMVEFSHAFGASPIYIAEDDMQWVARPDPAVKSWSGTLELLDGITLVQCGGHFEGSTVAHWAGGEAGRGALLTGDTAAVTADRKFLTFMRSYPNYIPLPAKDVIRIGEILEAYEFDAVYGGWWDSVIATGAREALRLSIERYVRWVGGSERLTQAQPS
jgi:glyoxylase-like metal-dependent hydrolase (beta-lactamase superfamily II)